MERKIRSLRRKYDGFKRGEEDVFAVRDEARLVLEDARRKGDPQVLEEVEDMLMDLEFSIEENRCKCHRKCSSC
ncbi:MAG: hypothetical protein ACE5OW_03355 [Candidatus Bathyarchaeia archaeon]